MLLSVKKVKEIYGIARHTLYRWEEQGLITPLRTPGRKRLYRKSDLDRLIGEIGGNELKTTYIYARVSTKKQEKYLHNQEKNVKEMLQ